MSYRDEVRQKILEALEGKDRRNAERHLKSLCDKAAATGAFEVEVFYNVDLSLWGMLERKDTKMFAEKFGLDVREDKDESRCFSTDWLSWKEAENTSSMYRKQLAEKATLAIQGRTEELHDLEVEIHIKGICDEAASKGENGAMIEYQYQLNDGRPLTREDIQKFAQKFGATFYKGEDFDKGQHGKHGDVIIFENLLPTDRPYGKAYL